MSRKLVLDPIYVSASGVLSLKDPAKPLVQSLAASFQTIATDVKFQDNLSYQINVNTSNSSGTFYLQGSNDGVNYADLMPCGAVAGANDEILINVNQFPFAKMRLSYVSSVAGTGTCNIILMARTVGA
jgi:hypothetical protein